MIVVVADASPLHYLALIEYVGILPVLFQTITIPSVVQDELTHPEAPQSVRDWMMRPPGWIDIRNEINFRVGHSQRLDYVLNGRGQEIRDGRMPSSAALVTQSR